MSFSSTQRSRWQIGPPAPTHCPTPYGVTESLINELNELCDAISCSAKGFRRATERPADPGLSRRPAMMRLQPALASLDKFEYVVSVVSTLVLINWELRPDWRTHILSWVDVTGEDEAVLAGAGGLTYKSNDMGTETATGTTTTTTSDTKNTVVQAAAKDLGDYLLTHPTPAYKLPLTPGQHVQLQNSLRPVLAAQHALLSSLERAMHPTDPHPPLGTRSEMQALLASGIPQLADELAAACEAHIGSVAAAVGLDPAKMVPSKGQAPVMAGALPAEGPNAHMRGQGKEAEEPEEGDRKQGQEADGTAGRRGLFNALCDGVKRVFTRR
ncbi:hypothetical protein NKR23_g3519 [Pleurostoma richardsiae]|uniref:Uncharacterized protein n=1 Tax=Pleurostoma richardsiae TaxID=41990 RepID=A0AA38RMC8_9PEZI|nr:hypothetical protein NKR23_g3519 [Pleurostoma richardsiae]